MFSDTKTYIVIKLTYKINVLHETQFFLIVGTGAIKTVCCLHMLDQRLFCAARSERNPQSARILILFLV